MGGVKQFSHLPVRQGFLCAFALILGALSTITAKILLLGINLFTQLFYFQTFSVEPISPSQNTLGWLAVFIPVIGGLIVGLMARFGSPAIRGHGIPEAMEKILTGESKIPRRVLFLKPISAAIAIGSGGPFGAEGPVIATGGALGSTLGQFFPTSETERRVLLACGAAAGMTAIFGTPFAAVLLAIELLLFEFRPKTFIPVALSAVTAATLRFAFLEKEAFLKMPDLAQPNMGEFGVYLLTGIFFGIVAVAASKSIYFLEDQFEKLPVHWMWWPALGGLIVGAIGLIEPLTLGVGYSNIENALNSQIALSAACLLMFLKFTSWAIALSSGTSGGTLAPLLTIGSLSGMILGTLLKNLFPDLGIDVHVVSLIGMAATFAGSSRALLASVVFSLEATHQPVGMVPVLGASCIAYLLSHRLMENSIMTEKIIRRGISVPHEYYSSNG